MGLKRCKDCGREISRRANRCPHCDLPQASLFERVFVWVLMAAALAVALWLAFVK